MNAFDDSVILTSLVKIIFEILALILFAFLVVLLYYILTLFSVKVEVGKSPEKSLLIAYRYAYQECPPSSKIFYKMLGSFPMCRGVKLCYTGPQVSYIEYAFGLILEENRNLNYYEVKDYIFRNMLTIFKTPEISFALHIVFPVPKWLPKYMFHWFAVTVGYIKLNETSQRHNLCGYPVIEVYDREHLEFIVPLIRQDEFVVWEAERVVFGRKLCEAVRPIRISPFQLNRDSLGSSVMKSPLKIMGKKKRG